MNPLGGDKPGISNDDYLGTVVNNEDPEEMCRCQVRVLEVHGDESQTPDDALPWAGLMLPVSHGSLPNKSGVVIPSKDSRVVVRFHKKDPYSPVMVGRLATKEDRHGSGFVTGDYVKTYGYEDPSGNAWFIDAALELLKAIMNGDIIIENTGKTEVTIGKNMLLKIAEGARIEIGDNAEVQIGSDANFQIGGGITWSVSGVWNASASAYNWTKA